MKKQVPVRVTVILLAIAAGCCAFGVFLGEPHSLQAMENMLNQRIRYKRGKICPKTLQQFYATQSRKNFWGNEIFLWRDKL